MRSSWVTAALGLMTALTVLITTAACSQVADGGGISAQAAPYTLVTTLTEVTDVVDTVTVSRTTTAVVVSTVPTTLAPESTIPVAQVAAGSPPADFSAYISGYFAARWADLADPALQDLPYCVKLRTESPDGTCWVVTVWSAVACAKGFAMKIDFFDGPSSSRGAFLGREHHVYQLPVAQGDQIGFTFVETFTPTSGTVSAFIADIRCI